MIERPRNDLRGTRWHYAAKCGGYTIFCSLGPQSGNFSLFFTAGAKVTLSAQAEQKNRIFMRLNLEIEQKIVLYSAKYKNTLFHSEA